MACIAGHQAVLSRGYWQTQPAAARPALALTFDPHPRALFNPDAPLFRLTPAAMKAEPPEHLRL